MTLSQMNHPGLNKQNFLFNAGGKTGYARHTVRHIIELCFCTFKEDI